MSLSRSALSGVGQFALGTTGGVLVDGLFPEPDPNANPWQELLEVLGEIALTAVVMAGAGRAFAAADPDNLTGGGMFFLGVISSQPGLKAKLESQTRRLRLSMRELLDPAVAAVQKQAQGL